MMKVFLKRSVSITDAFEVIANGSVMAYYNKDIDKCVAWVKLHYKLTDDELEVLKSDVK